MLVYKDVSVANCFEYALDTVFEGFRYLTSGGPLLILQMLIMHTLGVR